MTWWLQHALLVMALLAAATMAQAASVRSDVAQGNRLYKENRFEDSLRHYDAALKNNPESDIIHFNIGTTLYKQRRYAESIGHLQKALLSDDPSIHQMAQYNLGSALYKSGIAQEEKDLAKAVASLEKSLQYLGSAINLDKTDEDAQYNYDFVKKELERLLKKQQQRDQQQSSQGEKKDSQDQPQGSSKMEDGQGSPGQDQGQEKQNQEQQSQDRQAQEQGRQAGQSASSSPASQGKMTDMPTPHGQELTPSETKRLLEYYQQAEEPRGLFRAVQEEIDINDVSKDW